MTDQQSVYEALNKALACSRSWAAGRKDLTNVTRSSRFLSDACEELQTVINPCNSFHLKFVRVDDSGCRHSGEWLLDAVWTQDVCADELSEHKFPIRIRCAFECESSTSEMEFFRDLSKLVVVSSEIKLFAAGTNQKFANRAENYIRKRVTQVSSLLNHVHEDEHSTDWYLAFWPAPLNVEGQSLWEHLDSGRFPHLSSIRLYYWRDNGFLEVDASRRKYN